MQDADRQCSVLEKPQSSELRNRKRAAQKTSIRAERIRLFNKFIFMEENIMVVQHNLSAMNAQRYYGINNSGLSKSLEKLSSGYAINRAGDNAAGLAVSEKMRAQISGLTQASKNAQDGISMVQTFEGALTETDSILQRMRSLAVQSANGTYQNDVDREAIQLEYDQLNDELNQIADTDFNGVVVLNGGQMADGLKAVDGEFNYADAEREAMQLSKNDVNKVDYQLFDDKSATAGMKSKADDVWKEISNNKWDRSKLTNDQGPESVDVVLKFDSSDSTNPWKVDSASNGASKDKFQVVKTDNGGFKLQTAAGLDIANVVLDATALKNGDTLTLTLNNPATGVAAPTNIGASVTDTSKYTEDGGADSTKAKDVNLTTEIAAGLKDDKMSESAKKILDAFDGASVDVTYVSQKANTAEETKTTIKLADGSELKDIKADGADSATSLKDGTEVYIKSAGGKITVYAGKDDTGTELLSLTLGTHTATDKSAGTISYKLGIEYKNYDDSKLPTVDVKAPDSNNVSRANSNDASTATLTYKDNITLQVGARTKDSVNFTFAYESNGLGDLKADLDCSARGLGTDALSLSSQKDANAAIDKIDNAINKVSMVRGTFGAIQNRLEHKISNLDTNNENLTAAESRIRDTEMDKEMMKFTSNQILSQAAQSMLAQANSLPQGVLQLLG